MYGNKVIELNWIKLKNTGLITVKFCTYKDSCAVVVFAKFVGDQTDAKYVK